MCRNIYRFPVFRLCTVGWRESIFHALIIFMQEKGSGRETRRNLFLRGDFIVYGSVSPADDGAGSEWCKVCLFLQREKDTYEPERALRYLEGFCAA